MQADPLFRLRFRSGTRFKGNLVTQNTSTSKPQGGRDALTLLDALLTDSGRKRVGESQVMLILDALAGAADPALVERFPAVLAVCARNGIELNGQALLSRYWESSPKRKNLEKLLLISVALFEHQKIKPPGNLKRVAAGLRLKYPLADLSGGFRLSTGVNISMKGLYRTLRRFGLSDNPPARKRSFEPTAITPEADRLLDSLFSPKQKELIFKKLAGKPMTKTEREYFSRTSKKKLGAVLDKTVQDIARRICG